MDHHLRSLLRSYAAERDPNIAVQIANAMLRSTSPLPPHEGIYDIPAPPDYFEVGVCDLLVLADGSWSIDRIYDGVDTVNSRVRSMAWELIQARTKAPQQQLVRAARRAARRSFRCIPMHELENFNNEETIL